MRRLLLPVALLLSLSACAKPSAPLLTAQRANQVVAILDLVVDSTIAARDLNWITEDLERTVLTDLSLALPAIAAAPDGGVAAGLAVLKTTIAKLPAGSKIVVYYRWAEQAIGTLSL